MFNKVIDYFGGRLAMARIFNVNKSAITQWSQGDLPPRRAIEIEAFSKGKFTSIGLINWADEQRAKTREVE